VSRSNKPHGLLLVGHGTRDRQGRNEFFRTAELVALRAPDALVEPSFLELASPTITQGVKRLADQGAADLTVVPLLLFSAGHAKQDIPAAVQQAIKGTAFTEFVCARHLGCHPSVQELSHRRCQQVLSDLDGASLDGTSRDGASLDGASLDGARPEESLLLLVGRGSKDKDATAEMVRFAELRSVASVFHQTRVAFLALARPSLDELLEEIPALTVQRVVVQPHLLFHGELLTVLQQRIEQLAGRLNDQQWVVTPHLGPSNLLVEAILDRCLQALSGQGF